MNNKRHLHWSVIIENSFGFFAGIIILGLSSIDDIIEALMENDWSIRAAFEQLEAHGIYLWGVILFFTVLPCVVTGFNYIRWKNTYISLSQEAIIFERGKLVTKKSTIQTTQIASIQMQKNIFQRIMGTSKLKIDLNTVSSELSKIKIVLADKDAKEFRDAALKKYTGVEFNSTQHRENSLVNFSGGDIVKHWLLSVNLVTIVATVAFYSAIAVSAFSDGKLAGTKSIIIISLVMVVPMIYKSIMNFLSLGNFKVYRKGENIVLTYGTFTQSVYELPIHRINGVEIKQSLQARFLKKYCIEVVNAGLGDDKDEDKIISLYVDEATARHLMDELLPEFRFQKAQTIQPLKAMWIHLIPVVLVVGGFVAASILLSYWCLLGIVVFIPGFILNMKAKTIQREGSKLIIGHGILSKNSTVILAERIQKIETKQTWMSRLLNLESINVSVIGSAPDTGYFKREEIDKLAEELCAYCQ